jgi:hypothetical protein
MKTLKLVLMALIAICFLASTGFAASDAACLFLLISPSPRANGLGQTFLSLPETDAMIAFYNPATLGLFSLNHRFSMGFYPQRVSWLPGITNDIFYDNKAFNVGFKLPGALSAGIGFQRTYVDLGSQSYRNAAGEVLGSFKVWEKSEAITIGLGWQGAITAGFGLSIKLIDSRLGKTFSQEKWKDIKAEATAFDIGAIAQVPVLDLIRQPLAISLSKHGILQPFVTTTLAYAMRNIGDEITYIEASQSDPLPRTARVGLSFDLGMILRQRNLDWTLSSFQWATEAEDLLINNFMPTNNSLGYQSGLGDIDFFHDLFGGKNASITQMRGWQINFLEVVYLQQGRYEDLDGQVRYTTRGIGVGLAGWLKLVSRFFPESRTLRLVTDHFDLQYQWSKFEIENDHPLTGTRFTGLNLVIK